MSVKGPSHLRDISWKTFTQSSRFMSHLDAGGSLEERTFLIDFPATMRTHCHGNTNHLMNAVSRRGFVLTEHPDGCVMN